MKHNIYLYILFSGLISYLIRILPLTLIRKPITNRFLRSLLYYVPYVTLAVMTFPAIVQTTQYPLAGLLAMIIGTVLAWKGKGLPFVAGACCMIVLLVEAVLGR